jgi:hypothetical protein
MLTGFGVGGVGTRQRMTTTPSEPVQDPDLQPSDPDGEPSQVPGKDPRENPDLEPAPDGI